ncbi:MAG TPA: YfhO family protein, partial [Chitinophagaceae bacterium]|nr:YfhO family protein [Chitinophagaceae bacterium]
KGKPAEVAIVEEEDKSKIPFAPVTDSIAKINLVKNDNDIIIYESNAAANGFAVFSEIYYNRGWKAYIDDKETPIVQTNYVLRGIAVPAGKHNIRFEFKPESYYSSSHYAVAGSALAWLILIGAVFFEFKRRKAATLKAA